MRRVVCAGAILIVAAVVSIIGGCSRSGSTIPDGWKLTMDSSGSCQVATPEDWQIGRGFFLKVEPATTGPTGNGPRRLPPQGLALWGVDEANQHKLANMPAGKHFQMRASLAHGDAVCSAWRIKDSTDFTADEKSMLQQVGKTLRWVR